ncbi:MAG: hypothetical protein EBZ78_00660 [Verrucomicrobia bacterium]|nr:hypothetical protein [Verrucomicrobiota bacterium]
MSAAHALLSTNQENLKAVRRPLLETLAEEKRYSPEYVMNCMKENDLVRQLAACAHREAFSNKMSHFFRAWLLRDCLGLITDFLDSIGMQHAGGVIEADVLPPSTDQIQSAKAFFSQREPDRLSSFYLVYIYLEGGPFWQDLNSDQDWKSLVASSWNRLSPGSNMPQQAKDSAPSPENAEDFTLLDRLLIDSAVASRMKTFGAFDPDDLFALVEEIVSLNQKRQISVFHRGFLHALFDLELNFRFAGENEERRQWYLAGVISGLARMEKFDRCMEILKEQKSIANGLAANSQIYAGRMVLNILLPHLWRAKKFDFLGLLLAKQLTACKSMPKAVAILRSTYRLCADSVRQEQYLGEVIRVLRILLEDLKERPFTGPELGELAFLIQRKLAQALQGAGQMDEAIRLFEDLLVNGGGPLIPDVAADLALARGNIRSLPAAFKTLQTPEKQGSLRDSLESMREQLQGVISEGAFGTNAHILLGIYRFLDGPAGNGADSLARGHFSSALNGMAENAEAYETAGIYAWVRLLYAITLLESCDSGTYNLAVSLWQQACDGGLKIPAHLNERLLQAACLYDDSDLASRVAEELLRENLPASAVWLIGLPPDVRSRIAGPYLEWVRVVNLSAAALWPHLAALLPVCLTDKSSEKACEVLDLMERAAEASPDCAKMFISLLENEQSYMPAWSLEEAVDAKMAIWEREGRHEDVLAALSERFHRYRAKDGEIYLQEAKNIFQRMIEYLREHPDARFHLDDIERSISRATTLPEPGPSEKTRKLKILFVGGNETQERYISPLLKEWASTWPGLDVEFYMPGWDSSWNHHWELVRPKIQTSCAVVLSPLVRTQFGRTVRKNCDEGTPWFSCTGRGKASIKRSVEEAAKWVLSKIR